MRSLLNHTEQAEHEQLHELRVCRALPLRHAHELAEGAALELVARVEVAVRVARLDQVEQRETRSASRSVLLRTTNSVAVMPNMLPQRRCPNAVVVSHHSRCLRTREHELVSS